jgi:hypothetical protein
MGSYPIHLSNSFYYDMPIGWKHSELAIPGMKSMYRMSTVKRSTLTPFFRKQVFLSKICFGNPPPPKKKNLWRFV